LIVWLASYPKSGNTWVRLFLEDLLSSKNKDSNLNKKNKIYQYPLKMHFQELVNNFNNIQEISKNWSISQNRINLKKNITFFKTHHLCCEINGNNFTNLNNSLGVIHIIRDPRNVITSIKNHYDKKKYTDALDFMTDKYHCIDVENTSHNNLDKRQILNTLVSSWNNHYNSWKNFPKNYFCLKYEDLIKDPEKSFIELSEYVSEVLRISINKDKVKEISEKLDFEKLKRHEEINGFEEASVTKEGNKKIFFNLGKKNNWEEILESKIRHEIEKKFEKEMKEIGYL
jgi:hypothetical protein|tara:strand:+ start:79 stop:933 length:855 start_codon:yes stop_codon:yes gene_type:complete